ncbi:MAG: LytTR family DNA-binding domain-containing protein [Lachnospiraceae bacterium]|nr:LytTR family DNA-binding domain-containing protein [Lachnospiraceae bacterium]
MYLIALCDDETAELNKTEQIISEYEKKHPGIDFLIERFENANELLYKVKEKDYAPDFIFMDIYMPDKMGTDVVRELRSMGSVSKVIFLTTSKEHALEAYGMDAVQYLVKPIFKETLFSVLDRFSSGMEEKHTQYLLFRIEGKIQRVAVHDIIYCEAQGKIQRLHLTDHAQCVLRMTMTEIYEMLSRYPEFVRVGIAYIVNLEHVDNLNAREVQMDNGKKIYLPRGSYQPLRERYFGYYCGEEQG